jgi:ribonuclease T1
MLLTVAAIVVVGYLQQPRGAGDSGSDTATSGALPPEVAETIALIDAGGPFPYDRDGVVFMNRERLLPEHERGYWREYTVPTPGESDRGARRLVRGRAGELYYSSDHYASFVRVDEEGSG